MKTDQLSRALPDHFEFYHLGRVTLYDGAVAAGPLEDLLDGCATVGFSLYGDRQGLMIVAFEQDLDLSTYTELGNIIASQWATLLNRRDGLDAMISPPRALTPERLKALLPALTGSNTVVRTYLHRAPDQAEIPVHVLISEALQEAHPDARHGEA